MTNSDHPTTVAATVAALSRKTPPVHQRDDCRGRSPSLRGATVVEHPHDCRGQRRETTRRHNYERSHR